MVGKVSLRVLAQILVFAALRLGAVQRYRALVAGDHLRGPLGVEVAARRAGRRSRRRCGGRHRPAAWPRRFSTSRSFAPLWSLTSISAMRFNSGLLQLRQRVARRADFLAAALGGLLHEGDVVDGLGRAAAAIRGGIRRRSVASMDCAAMLGRHERHQRGAAGVEALRRRQRRRDRAASRACGCAAAGFGTLTAHTGAAITASRPDEYQCSVVMRFMCPPFP